MVIPGRQVSENDGRGFRGASEALRVLVLLLEYPSHSRPNFLHRRHPGLVSSHFTRRTLGSQYREDRRAVDYLPMWRITYLHVIQPLRTLGLLARTLLALSGRVSIVIEDIKEQEY
jgi:hypothetical protein